jgi:hypothetical protein
MGFGANFTKVTLGKNGQGADVLHIEGVSDREPERATELHVAVVDPERLLPAAGANGDQVESTRTASLKMQGGATTWRVTVPQGPPLPEAGAKVLVIGAAVLDPTEKDGVEDSPFFWSSILPVDK